MARKRKSEITTQRDHRRFLKWKDQLGRFWGATIEESTLHPVGPISPMFEAPLVVPQKYLKVPEDELGTLFIDFDEWIEDNRRAHAQYKQRRSDFAFANYGQAAEKVIKTPTPELLDYMGPPPMDERCILAAKSGNKWVNGIAKPDGTPFDKPDWADALFPDKPLVLSVDEEMDELAEQFPDVDEEFEEVAV